MYYIVYGLLYLLSLLPLRVLYLLSDFFCFLFFRVFKYRREVALKNLAIAFPEKTEEERIGIARDFYRNLTDTLIETIKMISVSYSFIEKRVSGDWAMVDKLYDSGRNVQIHLGHNFNWEWANSVFTKKVRYPFLVVYMPLGSKVFDRLMLEQRSRFGSVLLNAKKMHEEFLKHVNSQFVLCLAADQTRQQRLTPHG
jgi:Kdo2-lipid IVA lauroyltransferase/acyltransferase